MVDSIDSTTRPTLPTSATFSFTSPFPVSVKQATLKQRRTSLASTSSPRLVPAWNFRDDTDLEPHTGSEAGTVNPEEKKGKMRRSGPDDQKPTEVSSPPIEKRQRKKWTEAETQMLVDGCNIWGVGNWKAILNDSNLKFDNRSPVDLKDRFRTFFPDAYKVHYPNAKTHLSTKVRSTLPDGSSLFEKTRSKKRRPFTTEEDQALKAGYEKYGTVWSTIVKDPIFQEQKRRSTDLRDRFRNAFPDLYQAAGYKPRTVAKKKQADLSGRHRAAADDQYVSPRAQIISRRRRASANLSFSRSVPQSAAGSEDEDSSDEEDNVTDFTSLASVRAKEATPQPEVPPEILNDDDVHSMEQSLANAMILDGLNHASQSLADLSEVGSQSQLWSPLGQQSPLPLDGWSSAATTSPTSSHFSTDYFTGDGSFSGQSNASCIGNSAWEPSDWLSGNPRLEPSATSSSSSSLIGGFSPTPSSPFSFSNLSHGILDRYDLFRTLSNDFTSELGPGDTHSTFSDPDLFPTQSFRGFTHHSDYAGDLIFGARTHPPLGQGHYGSSANSFTGTGLGLTGISHPPASINPIQLHTPGLPGIDELEITSIHLDDTREEDHPMSSHVEVGVQKDEDPLPFPAELSALINLPPQTFEEIVRLSTDVSTGTEQDMSTTPPATPVRKTRNPRDLSHVHSYSTMHNRSSSVPPFEHRPPPRTIYPQSDSNLQSTQTPSIYDSHLQNAWMPQMPSHVGATMVANSETMRSTGDFYDLPFLDLHYFNTFNNMQSSGHHGQYDVRSDGIRHGQALDLAQTSMSHGSIGYPTGAILTGSFDQGAYLSGAGQIHHTQSSVSPKDLLLQKTSEI